MSAWLAEAAAPLRSAEFWLIELAKVLSVYSAAWLGGQAVARWGVRVNYTRKVNHFVIFFVPLLLVIELEAERTLVTGLVSGAVFLVMLGLFVRPIRSRVGVLATMFRSYDRPEDRPYTLLWLSTQVVAGYAVLIPLAMSFNALGRPELTYIPILINAIGDGLAEPVGVRFGRHPYRVRALHGDRVYVRTLEGSACVLVTSIVVVIAFGQLFSPAQFWVTLALLPVLMTLAEARAPHTWDSPMLFLVGGTVLLAVVTLLP